MLLLYSSSVLPLYCSSALFLLGCFTDPGAEDVGGSVRVFANNVDQVVFHVGSLFQALSAADRRPVLRQRLRRFWTARRRRGPRRSVRAAGDDDGVGPPFTTDRSTIRLNMATPSIASVFQYWPVQAIALLAIEGGVMAGAGSVSRATTVTRLRVSRSLIGTFDEQLLDHLFDLGDDVGFDALQIFRFRGRPVWFCFRHTSSKYLLGIITVASTSLGVKPCVVTTSESKPGSDSVSYLSDFCSF